MTNFVHIDLSSHVLIFESPWRPNMTSSQTAGFLTYWQSAYHPSIYAIICFNHSLVHLSVGTNSTRLYQEFTYSILNTTVSFDPCPFSLAFAATKRHESVKFGSPLNLLASSRSDIGTSLGKNVDLFGLFRWITKTPGFLRGAAECCHFCWFENGGNGASRIWWKYENHTFYFNT